MQQQLKDLEDQAAELGAEGAQAEAQGAGEGEGAGGEGGEGGEGDEGAGGAGEGEGDGNQVYVGNLDEAVTPNDLNEFFKSCGVVNRITILCDKFTGKAKGFAYMEFDSAEAVELALGLNETEMNGRQIKVSRKRKNVPRWQLRGGPRGGFRGGPRGGFRGGFRGSPSYSGYQGGGGGYRGGGGGYRGGRGGGGYSPYRGGGGRGRGARYQPF